VLCALWAVPAAVLGGGYPVGVSISSARPPSAAIARRSAAATNWATAAARTTGGLAGNDEPSTWRRGEWVVSLYIILFDFKALMLVSIILLLRPPLTKPTLLQY